jgi:hypothetical protein
MVRVAAKMGLGSGLALALFIGLLAYSYSQIQYRLQEASVVGIDWSPLSAATIANATTNLETGDYGALALNLIQKFNLVLSLNITNRGFLPVNIPDFSYGLHINGADMGPGSCQGGNVLLNPGETRLFHCSQDISRNGIEAAAASLLETKGIMNVQVDGTAYPQAFGISLPIPVHDSKQVSMRDQIEKYLTQTKVVR